jgi:hypothetical protein
MAIVVNLLGAYAYTFNKAAHDISFASLVSSTTDSTITTLFKTESPSHRGKLPLPEGIAEQPIKFTPLDEGGLGFQTADEVRRRSSLGVSSPVIRALGQVTMVVEEVSTHDHVLCHSVWFKSASNMERPKASIQIYDTSSSTYHADDAKCVVEKLGKIFGGSTNHANPAPYPDRLDVYDLPVSRNMSEKERVGLCIAHQMAEIEYRKTRLKEWEQWGIQTWDMGPECKWKRFLVVVDTEMEKWEDNGLLFVWFEPVEVQMDVKRWRGGMEILSKDIAEVRAGFNWEVGGRQFDGF